VVLEAEAFVELMDPFPFMPAGADDLVAAVFLSQIDSSIDQLAAIAETTSFFLDEKVFKQSVRPVMVKIVLDQIDTGSSHFFSFYFQRETDALAADLLDVHNRKKKAGVNNVCGLEDDLHERMKRHSEIRWSEIVSLKTGNMVLIL